MKQNPTNINVKVSVYGFFCNNHAKKAKGIKHVKVNQ